MDNRKFFSLLFISLVSALLVSSLAIYVYAISLDRNVLRAEPYLKEIVYNDLILKELALNYTSSCGETDISCKVNEVYRNVVESKKYLPDIDGQEVIKSPFETISQMGGDCEDLAILASSLLENLNIPTYLVLTQNHAYALACGVDLQKTKEYGQESLKEIYAGKLQNETNLEVSIIRGEIFLSNLKEDNVTLKPGEGFVLSSGKEEGMFNLEYSFSSKDKFRFYVVLSQEEIDKFVDGQVFNFVKACTLEAGSCQNLPANYLIFIYNPNPYKITVDSKFNFIYHYDSSRLLVNQSRSFYRINNETCVVLETTAGEYGFVGLSSEDLEGEKLAFDPRTKEYFILG